MLVRNWDSKLVFSLFNALNFQKKRDLAINILNSIEELECYKPEGAFYLFPKCSRLFGLKTQNDKTISCSNDFAEYLLEHSDIAVVPGVAFGLEGYFRISFATSEEEIEKACLKIVNACKQLIRD